MIDADPKPATPETSNHEEADLMEIHGPNADTLAADLAESVADSLRRAVAKRGAASLAVSGGSTPLPFFRHLRRHKLPWNQVSVTLADERWVDTDHEDSNEALVRRELLVEEASGARFVPLKNDAPTPEKGEDACEKALAGLSWPLDVLILGMGGDGHTASLFPKVLKHSHAVRMGLDLDTPAAKRCIAMHPAEAPHPRLSLTLKALLDCRRLILHITGEGKKKVYEKALAGGPVDDLPIRAILRQTRRPVEVHWAP